MMMVKMKKTIITMRAFLVLVGNIMKIVMENCCHLQNRNDCGDVDNDGDDCHHGQSSK